MKRKDVEVGATYAAKVSGRIVPVRIDGINPRGGYFGRNTLTGREVRLRSAARLRYRTSGRLRPGVG